MYISVQVTVILGRVLVLWTILDFHEENETFSDLFSSIKAGKYNIDVSEELKGARLVKNVCREQDRFIDSVWSRPVCPTSLLTIWYLCEVFC